MVMVDFEQTITIDCDCLTCQTVERCGRDSELKSHILVENNLDGGRTQSASKQQLVGTFDQSKSPAVQQ